MIDVEPRSALLVMDIQAGIIDRVPDSATLVAHAKEAMGAARSHGIPVIHVVVGFRSGLPEVSTRNQSFSLLIKAPPPFVFEPRPLISPEGAEVVVTKRRISAFTGSDLEVVLRAGDRDDVQGVVELAVTTTVEPVLLALA